MLNFWALKISRKENKFAGWFLIAELAGRDLRDLGNLWALSGIFRLFWIVKTNAHLNQATQKNTCQILLRKKIPESKISNPRKSFDHPRRLKSGTPPPRSRLRSLMVCFSRWLKMAIYSVEVSQGLVFCITKVTKWTANCETSRCKIPFASCRRQYFPFVIQAKVWLTCPHISSHFWLFRVKFQEI